MSWKKTCSFLGEWHLSCITINQRTLTTHSHYWQSYSDIVYIHMNRISFLLKCSTTAANSKCTQYISVGHVKAIIISLFFRCLLRMLEDVHSIIGLVFFTTKCSTLLNRSHSHTCELLLLIGSCGFCSWNFLIHTFEHEVPTQINSCLFSFY